MRSEMLDASAYTSIPKSCTKLRNMAKYFKCMYLP